jgi:hypothetical protein
MPIERGLEGEVAALDDLEAGGAQRHFYQKTEGNIMDTVDRIVVGANDISQPDS